MLNIGMQSHINNAQVFVDNSFLHVSKQKDENHLSHITAEGDLKWALKSSGDRSSVLTPAQARWPSNSPVTATTANQI